MISCSFTGVLAWVSHLEPVSFHWGFVAYTDLDTLQSTAYIGNDVKVRFTMNADSFSKAALNSTQYIPFRLANYPRNCVFPAEPAILRKMIPI
jgi:hypothetical protein